MAMDNNHGAQTNSTEWNAASWLQSLNIHGWVLQALQVPNNGDHLRYIRSMTKTGLSDLLAASNMQGLLDLLWPAVEELQKQAHATASELNSKFQQEATIKLSYGTLDTFYGGLTALVGPPRQIEGSLWKAMEFEHCRCQDSGKKFTSSNGMSTYSALEWEFAVEPQPGQPGQSCKGGKEGLEA